MLFLFLYMQAALYILHLKLFDDTQSALQGQSKQSKERKYIVKS